MVIFFFLLVCFPCGLAINGTNTTNGGVPSISSGFSTEQIGGIVVASFAALLLVLFFVLLVVFVVYAPKAEFCACFSPTANKILIVVLASLAVIFAATFFGSWAGAGFTGVVVETNCVVSRTETVCVESSGRNIGSCSVYATASCCGFCSPCHEQQRLEVFRCEGGCSSKLWRSKQSTRAS